MQTYHGHGGLEALREGKHQQSWMVGKHSDEPDAAVGLKVAILKLPEHNISWNSDKYISQYGQIHFTICTNAFPNLDKYISQFGQITFHKEEVAIFTQDFLKFRQIYIQI